MHCILCFRYILTSDLGLRMECCFLSGYFFKVRKSYILDTLCYCTLHLKDVLQFIFTLLCLIEQACMFKLLCLKPICYDVLYPRPCSVPLCPTPGRTETMPCMRSVRGVRSLIWSPGWTCFQRSSAVMGDNS